MTTLADFSEHEDEILAEYENEDADEDCKNLSNNDVKGQDNNVPKRIDPSTSHKHIKRNSIPTLNAQRLKGPKGIHTIEKHFEGFKYYGKGQEKMDLDRVMKRLEHWAHRLFPKLHFDDFLERTEKLGSKKDLSVFITKYRKDMVTPDEDEVSKNNATDDEYVEDNLVVDAFDLLIAEQIEKQKDAMIQHNLEKDEMSACNDTYEMSQNNVIGQCFTQTTDKDIEVSNSQSNSVKLSEEIKDRIERNRQQAIQRRLAKLKALKEDSSEIKRNTDMST